MKKKNKPTCDICGGQKWVRDHDEIDTRTQQNYRVDKCANCHATRFYAIYARYARNPREVRMS